LLGAQQFRDLLSRGEGFECGVEFGVGFGRAILKRKAKKEEEKT